MAVGLGMLGLSSREFWEMTPAEFHAALDGRREAQSPLDPRGGAATPAELRDLMARFPDGKRGANPEGPAPGRGGPPVTGE